MMLNQFIEKQNIVNGMKERLKRGLKSLPVVMKIIISMEMVIKFINQMRLIQIFTMMNMVIRYMKTHLLQNPKKMFTELKLLLNTRRIGIHHELILVSLIILLLSIILTEILYLVDIYLIITQLSVLGVIIWKLILIYWSQPEHSTIYSLKQFRLVHMVGKMDLWRLIISIL